MLAAAAINGWGRRQRGPERGARSAGWRVGGRAGEGRGLRARGWTGWAEELRRKAEHRDLCREAPLPRAPRRRARGVLNLSPAPAFHALPPAGHPGARLSASASPGSGPSPALEGTVAFTDTSAETAPETAQAGPRREHRGPPKECTTPGAALNTDRARRAHKNGHCRYFLVAEREPDGEGIGTSSKEMEGLGGVGPGRPS